MLMSRIKSDIFYFLALQCKLYRPAKCTVTCIPTARQRVDIHITATYAHATIDGHPLLGDGPVNTPKIIRDNIRLRFPRGQSKVVKRRVPKLAVVESSRVESGFETLPCRVMSLGAEELN
jgi:hypothetical protein